MTQSNENHHSPPSSGPKDLGLGVVIDYYRWSDWHRKWELITRGEYDCLIQIAMKAVMDAQLLVLTEPTE